MPDGTDTVDVGRWLDGIGEVLAGHGESSVPCGECSACCAASQFIHIEPHESTALDRIPAELLFPAPGLPAGHVLLGYDEHGRCPMLAPDGCTIYADRPRACRAYDCRVFAIAGLAVDEPGKQGIASRVEAWRLSVRSTSDADRLSAVRAAADFMARSDATAGLSATARALAALQVHELFLGPHGPVQPDAAVVMAALRSARDREAVDDPSRSCAELPDESA